MPWSACRRDGRVKIVQAFKAAFTAKATRLLRRTREAQPRLPKVPPCYGQVSGSRGRVWRALEWATLRGRPQVPQPSLEFRMGLGLRKDSIPLLSKVEQQGTRQRPKVWAAHHSWRASGECAAGCSGRQVDQDLRRLGRMLATCSISMLA